MTTAFDLLHRDLQRKLWDMNWTELRSIQDQAIRHLLLGGGDAVIASPTASGKTEAAFLPVLSAIADSPMGSVRAMYIGPLKALINDQFRRVEDLCERLELPVCKWHGDVGDSSKHKLLEAPGGVLLITPESLEAMLVRRPTTMPRIFSRLSFVVVDEMHAFMGNERGAQLLSQLHRLSKRAGCDPIRIGLSATLGEPESARRWLRPGGPLATWIEDAAARSAIQIRVRGIWRRSRPNGDTPEAEREVDDRDPAVRELAREILLACSGKTNLVFANSKAKIEVLADALVGEAGEMKLGDEIVVHHGSLSRERRLYAEERLRSGRACTAVCSNTLELGIDIGGIDEVVQVAAPWSVASLVQRVGRSGRREGAARVLRGFFVEQTPDEKSDVWDRLHLDLLQGIATVELMLERFLEPPALNRAHLSTLVHQCLAFLAETGGSTAVGLFHGVASSGAFGKVSQADFATVLRELGARDLIEQMGDGSLILGLAGQKLVEHYTFFAAFNAPDELRVVHGSDEIGAVAMPPAPGEYLILAGRRWRVESLDVERREVVVSPGRGGRAPVFHPTRGVVHPSVHAKMKALLLGASKPAYLDSVAMEILASARLEAVRCEGFRASAQAYEGGVRLFVFAGSRVQQTLSLVLSKAGFDAAYEDVGFDVAADASRVAAALRAFASKPDLLDLAEYADRVQRRREFGREKFEAFVAPEVWRRAYAREELDERASALAALSLSEALTARTVRGPLAPNQPPALSEPVRMSPGPLLSPSQEPPSPPATFVSAEGAGRAPAFGKPFATSTFTPLVSLLFGGAALTEHDDLSPGAAQLGCPVWGESQLLANLELRLGLPQAHRAQAVRVQQWSQRMAELEAARPGRFYARSHGLDSVGTAETLLAWRDELITSGWNGDAIPNGGDRLETLRQLAEGVDVLPGQSDRLRCVEGELRVSGTPLFDALLLAEPRTLWPGRWQRVFALLEELGTVVRVKNPSFEATAGDSDLAWLQSALRGDAVDSRRLRGDGSLLLVCAETSWELAEATAALLRVWEEPSTAIIRGGELRPLDYALSEQGFASQGLDATSAWRPALQVLPLAMELAFEPRDPYRMLEILTLPAGPFQGLVGSALAGALADAPGIGGPAWRQAKERIVAWTRAKVMSDAAAAGIPTDDANRAADERVASLLERVATWFEKPGLDASKPAPRATLLEVADRVRIWLRDRLAMAQADAKSDSAQPGLAGAADILASAFARAQEFHATLSHESRAALDLVDVRLLLEQVSSGHTLTLAAEAAGRIDPVDSPAALRRGCDVVVWWHCVGGTEWRSAIRPWRHAEVRALRGAGVVLPDMAERLAAEGKSWHNAVLAARKRLVLAMPRWALGQALEPHPVWHEIAARLAADGAALASITIEARDLLAGRAKAFGVPVRDLGPLPLPPARSEWQLDPTHLGASVRHSATSLDALLGCPLRWVFGYPGGVRRGTLDSIARGPQLSGTLGHRLVEELHLSGALAKPAALGDAIGAVVDRLLREEAAVLLRPGMTFELAQLRQQLGRAVRSLAETLAESKLTVAGVEVVVEAQWRAGTLHGRLDLLLSDERGRDVVLDLKWGAATYRELIENGRATQLAIYAEARKLATKAREMPAAAYFSLSQGKVLAPAGGPFAGGVPIDGPPLAETWAKLERTVDRVERTVLAGRIAVTGVRRSMPLLEMIGVGPGELDRHLANEKGAACKYCEYGALCGQKWEGLT